MSGYLKPYAERTLKTRYRQLALRDETIDLLHRYFSAFANLYGILTLKDAYKIINKQNPNLLSFSKLYEFSQIVQRETNNIFYIVDQNEMWMDMTATKESREIVAEDLLSLDDKPYYELINAQNGKPLYIPPKETLLLYEKDDYFEKNQFTDELENFLKKEMNLDSTELEYLMIDIIFSINLSDQPMQDALDALYHCGIDLSKEQTKTFLIYLLTSTTIFV